MESSSQLLDEVIGAFASLPGVGHKSAMRFALWLMDRPEKEVEEFSQAVLNFRSRLKRCRKCGHLSDYELCAVCSDSRRDHQTICVVESVRDVLAIEATHQYHGAYHVLGGVISPIDGIGPEQLAIEGLIDRVQNDSIKEVILAVRPTIEGDTTSYFLTKRMNGFEHCKFSIISRGISFGGELEYTDEVTLGRSITGRLPYEAAVLNGQ